MSRSAARISDQCGPYGLSRKRSLRPGTTRLKWLSMPSLKPYSAAARSAAASSTRATRRPVGVGGDVDRCGHGAIVRNQRGRGRARRPRERHGLCGQRDRHERADEQPVAGRDAREARIPARPAGRRRRSRSARVEVDQVDGQLRGAEQEREQHARAATTRNAVRLGQGEQRPAAPAASSTASRIRSTQITTWSSTRAVLVEVRVADAVGAHVDHQRADVEQAHVGTGRGLGVVERAGSLAAGADRERLHAVDGAALVAVQVAGEDRRARLAQAAAGSDRRSAAGGGRRRSARPARASAAAAARRRSPPGSFGSSPRIDDLDRPLVHREAAALGQVERAADRARAREEVVVVAEADVHRRAAHEVGERAEDVAIEQHLGGHEVGVVAGRDREVGALGGEQPADRPLVVVARAVVGEHGEAHRAVERGRRRRERAAGLRRAVDARDPRVAVVGLEAAQDAARDVDLLAFRR